MLVSHHTEKSNTGITKEILNSAGKKACHPHKERLRNFKYPENIFKISIGNYRLVSSNGSIDNGVNYKLEELSAYFQNCVNGNKSILTLSLEAASKIFSGR